MFRSDASGYVKPLNEVVNSLNIDIIAEIERELQDDPYDLISLVFLLYDVPDTALQRLIIFQRVSSDICSTNLNLLHEWFRYANTKPNWKEEFLEALVICQMYNIIKKLGIDVEAVKSQYQPDNINFALHVNHVRKILYKVCENMNNDNLSKLKKTLLTYKIYTMDLNSCEMVFLKLMCLKFISVNQIQYDKKVLKCEYNVEKLARILESFVGLQGFASVLRSLQGAKAEQELPEPSAKLNTSSTPNIEVSMDVPNSNSDDNQDVYTETFDDLFDIINKLKLDEGDDHFKADATKLDKHCYQIKNPNRIGLCVIINQEEFYPSRGSLMDAGTPDCLESRQGSTRDKVALERTMSRLNFVVVSATNLDHNTMIEFLKQRIINDVDPDDSIFMLCILSHGVRGHVFAADSVKVKVEDLQDMLDSDFASHLRSIPKVLIIQACQVDNVSSPVLVADTPISQFYLRKSNFLTYWATAPEYEAYRHIRKGSIFIQMLCNVIQARADKEHLYDIFTKVTNCVTGLCTKLQRAQVPIFVSSLRKNLYLQIPK